MAIQLPDLTTTQCIYLQACGRLSDATEPSLAPEKELVARSRTASGAYQFIRLLQTGDPVTHVHVDVARKEYFGGAIPKVTSRKGEFNSAIAAYRGRNITLWTRAVYGILAASLPPSGLILAGPNKIVTRLDEVEVELTGAFLDLKDGPVDRIEWQVVKEFVLAELIVTRDATVSDTYITEAFDSTHEAFRTFVLGKTTLPS